MKQKEQPIHIPKTGKFNRLWLDAATAVLLSMVLTASASSADNVALMAFARANVEKFRTEPVATRGITYGSKVTVAFTDDELDLYWTYDLDKGELVHHGLGLVGEGPQLAPVHCIEKGTFNGQNSYGAKFVVRRKDCERFYIGNDPTTFEKDGSTAEVEAPTLKIPPSVYRKIQKEGVRAEADFTVGLHGEQELINYSDSILPATGENPIETRVKVWVVYAKLRQIRWSIPGEIGEITIWTAPD